MQSRKFELFLASLMSHRKAAAHREAFAASYIEAGAHGFWASPPLGFFEQRLQPVGCDTLFDVALPHHSGIRRYRFALNLWPDFELGVLAAPDGDVFYPHFVRRPGVIVSIPQDAADILPWSATFEEVLGRLGSPLDASSWDFRRWVTYAFGADRCVMTFDLGLVQSVLPEREALPRRRNELDYGRE